MKDEHRQTESSDADDQNDEKNQIAPGFQFSCAFLD